MRVLMPAALTSAFLLATPTLPSLAAEPIAATDGEAPGVTLQVKELKVSNGAVMLKFSIANDGDGPFDPDTLADKDVKGPDYHSISGVYLIDVANKKKYLVMYDTANQCVCSRGTHNIAAKSSANLWAKFPAPPDNVQKIGIVVPHFVPIEDAPLSR